MDDEVKRLKSRLLACESILKLALRKLGWSLPVERADMREVMQLELFSEPGNVAEQIVFRVRVKCD